MKTSFAQNDSCHVRISLLTCSPGEELYSTFGHTALRIIDSSRQFDIVFNYGTFDFSDPNFYTKFVKGKLEYFLSVSSYPEFLEEYIADQRSVWEQVLQLNCEQKMAIVQAIETNMIGANRFYKYDFLYDNCTTRVRDLIFKNIDSLQIHSRIIEEETTSRGLIHSYLDAGGEPWSKLGIDILLGSKLDKPVTNYEAMFLPEYLMKGVDSAYTPKNKRIVLSEREVYEANPSDTATARYVPLFIISMICFLFFIFYFMSTNWAVKFTKFLDSLLLYITGLAGLLLLFMWFGTDHVVCRDNYNLLWALPTNFIAAFFVWKNPPWLRAYFYLAFAIYALLLVFWFWLPQYINFSILPLILLMLFRYGKLASGKE
ncbi:MAG: Lnb N-terminal periplasmic domain-containing protein [Ilyomonas sp.]